jgi:hypothetical protein
LGSGEFRKRKEAGHYSGLIQQHTVFCVEHCVQPKTSYLNPLALHVTSCGDMPVPKVKHGKFSGAVGRNQPQHHRGGATALREAVLFAKIGGRRANTLTRGWPVNRVSTQSAEFGQATGKPMNWHHRSTISRPRPAPDLTIDQPGPHRMN